MFKVGAKVVCMDASGFGQKYLILGGHYTIKNNHPCVDEVFLEEVQDSWSSLRFNLIGVSSHGQALPISQDLGIAVTRQTSLESYFASYLGSGKVQYKECQCGQKGIEWAKHSDYCPLYEKA